MPQIHIDNFTVADSRIIAYTLIDGADIDWNINRDEFETWVDEKELRDFERNIPGSDIYPERDVMCRHEWVDIYNGFEVMEGLLIEYIRHLYESENVCSKQTA